MVDWITDRLARGLAPGGPGARLSILIYHRVLPEPDALLPDEVDAATFDWQMRCVARCFRVLPLSEAVDGLARGTLPSRAACVTFDDGYANNAEIALPILQRHGLRAAFFVASGFLDGGYMFNDRVIEAVRGARGERLDLGAAGLGEFDVSSAAARRQCIDALLRAVKYLPLEARLAKSDRIGELAGVGAPVTLMMRSDQVRTLHAAGMEIGAHTVNHPILTQLDEAAARAEIANGRQQLEAIIGVPVSLFAYPNGIPTVDYAHQHVAMVKQLGFKAAVSTAPGVSTRGSDPFQLPRFTPWDRSPARFNLRLVRNLLDTAPRVA